MITSTGGCKDEIKQNIVILRAATTKLNKLRKNRTKTKNTNLRLLDALIFEITTYASEI